MSAWDSGECCGFRVAGGGLCRGSGCLLFAHLLPPGARAKGVSNSVKETSYSYKLRNVGGMRTEPAPGVSRAADGVARP